MEEKCEGLLSQTEMFTITTIHHGSDKGDWRNKGEAFPKERVNRKRWKMIIHTERKSSSGGGQVEKWG